MKSARLTHVLSGKVRLHSVDYAVGAGGLHAVGEDEGGDVALWCGCCEGDEGREGGDLIVSFRVWGTLALRNGCGLLERMFSGWKGLRELGKSEGGFA